MQTRQMPRPFLKWAGGKRSLQAAILQHLPATIDCYVEPFLGGGAIFFALARAGRLRRAILSDRNPELILIWRIVRDRPGELIETARQWGIGEDDYYQVRALDPASLDPVTQAARVLYLNKLGFNGLYRLNRKGGFNVPFGRHRNPTVADEPNLLACSRALADVELRSDDFEDVLASAPAGSTIYCDPPYWPVSKTANFNAYDGQVFGEAEQVRLSVVFHHLAGAGLYGVLSNSYTPETCRLYSGLPHETVQVARLINRDAAKRGPVPELLVRTAPEPPE